MVLGSELAEVEVVEPVVLELVPAVSVPAEVLEAETPELAEVSLPALPPVDALVEVFIGVTTTHPSASVRPTNGQCRAEKWLPLLTIKTKLRLKTHKSQRVC